MIEIWAKSARFKIISQRLTNLARMILKNGWFEIVKIYQVNREYQQDTITRTETLKTEKQETPNRIETQNNENRNTTHLNTTK